MADATTDKRAVLPRQRHPPKLLEEIGAVLLRCVTTARDVPAGGVEGCCRPGSAHVDKHDFFER